MSRKKIATWLAVPLALALCIAPMATSAVPREDAAAIAPVSAPAPTTVSQNTEAADYLAASAHLEALGMNASERHVLWSRLGSQLLPALEQGSLSADELFWLSIPNYHPDRAQRYLDYEALYPELTPSQVILDVNMDLDRPFYTEIAPITEPDSLTALINKYNVLQRDYVPPLETLGRSYGTGSLHPEAASQFRAMVDAAKLDGITLYSVSAYRSYATQSSIYNRYLTQYSRNTVDQFSARPGHSEHQSGLAVDINVASRSAGFEWTEEYAWLLEHCAEFGFILRYPLGKESVTGYRFESWHYRYVGTDIARRCMEQGLAYEEYIAGQPDEALTLVPTLTCQDRVLDPNRDTLLLNDTWYVSAQALAQLAGWNCRTSPESDEVVVYGGNGCRLILSPGLRCQRDGFVARLNAPALLLDDTLYLSVLDLCSLMQLRLKSTPLGLELIQYQLL